MKNMKQKMASSILSKYKQKEPWGNGFVFYPKRDRKSTSIKIPWDLYPKFIKEFSSYINSENYKNEQLYEFCNQGELISLRYVFIFEFTDPDLKKLDESFYDELYPILKSNIENNLKTKDEENLCCVCQSEIENGIMISEICFPMIRANVEFFNAVMKPSLCTQMSKMNLRKNLPSFRNDWIQIIEDMSYLNHVYGTPYKENFPIPIFLNVWSNDGKIDDNISGNFSVTNNIILIDKCGDGIDYNDYEDIIQFVITNIYSKDTSMEIVSESKEFITDETENGNPESNNQEDILNSIFNLLPEELLDDPLNQYLISRCVFNIYCEDDESRVNEAEEFLSNNCKIDVDWTNIFRKFKSAPIIERYLSVRTIGFLIKSHNSKKYEEWHNTWVRFAIEKAAKDIIEIDIAEILYRYFWLNYLTVGVKDWYVFKPNGTTLINCGSSTNFSKRIGEVVKFINEYKEEIKSNVGSGLSTPIKVGGLDHETRVSNIGKIIKTMGSSRGISNLTRLCFVKFHREDVDKSFDTNFKLFAWNNTIVEIYNEKINIRPGKMEDFITMKSDITYRKGYYSFDDPNVKALMYWFKQVFGSKELIDYFLKICSSFLYGRNIEKYVYVFCGGGDNSKSMICKLLQKVLSTMAVDLPSSVLTDNAQKSCFGTEVAQAKGARAAFVSEPEESIPFQGNLVKRLSGGDRIFARKLYQDNNGFDPMFKIIIQANEVPRNENADAAVKNRYNILPFSATYTFDPPESEEEQFERRIFKKDLKFEQKIDNYLEPMAWLMCEYFNKYMEEKIIAPKEVLDFNEKYWSRTDPYRRFVIETYEKTNSPGDKISLNDVYSKFKIWFAINMKSQKSSAGTKISFQRYVSATDIFGQPSSKNIWSGWKLAVMEDDVKSDDGII